MPAEKHDRLTGMDLYQAIRRGITSLQFAPGQLLSENELANRYNSSRTPVRDALKILEREGLVRISSRRKTMVAPLDLSAYRQAVFAREVMETAAAKEAAMLFHVDDEKRLSQMVSDQSKALQEGNVPLFDTLDLEFHRQIFGLGRLEHIAAVVDSLRGLTDRMRTTHLTILTQYNHERVVDQHAAIADAIESGDVERAGAEMSAHVVSVFKRVAQLARERPEFFGDAPDDEVERLEEYLSRGNLNNPMVG